MGAHYLYLREYQIDPARREEFENHYGRRSTWVTLFQQAPGYVDTVLLKDSANPLRHVTIDRWESGESCRSFRSTHAGQYADLDQRCEFLTIEETLLGQFAEVSAP